MLDSIHGLGEPNALIRKALTMIINGLLTYEISFSLIKNSGSAEIISAIVFALSILIGDILIPSYSNRWDFNKIPKLSHFYYFDREILL